MGILHKGEREIFEISIKDIPIEIVEKQFIIDFFKELPIEDLKKMINFKKIDYNNKDLWADSRENNRLFSILNELRQRKSIKFTCELYLDNGVKSELH